MMFVAWVLAAAAPATGLQTQFEQATAALEARKWDEAAADFHAIEIMPAISARTRGVVLLREGTALMHLNRDDEAIDALRKGLALVPKNEAVLNGDRFDALIALGGFERGYYDYAAARREFAEARGLATDDGMKLKALLALAAVTMFDDVKTARAAVDEAAAIEAATKVAPAVDAAIKDMRGKVLLNQGDPAAALAALQVAVKDEGGLTERTDIEDAMVRSDAALAALKAKQDDRAREFLAMSGEGRLPDGPFAAPADTNVPPCGGDIRPDDVIVVEFGIGDDGKVTFANPIYASRQGPMVVEFAKAVSGWAWRQSDVKSIPLFFRAATRVELRCSNAVERPGDAMLLEPALETWLAEKKVSLPARQDPQDASRLRAELERRKDARPIERLPYLFALSQVPTVEDKEKEALLQQAVAIVTNEHAPPAVQALFRILLLTLNEWQGQSGLARYHEGLRALLAAPGIADDVRAGNVVRLILAAPARGSVPRDAVELLQHVADDKRLDAHDPLRVGALVRLASVQAQQGDLAAARQTYLGTGLDSQQCALVDAKPSMRRTGVNSSDYPVDAVRWGIGGWTRIEFDVEPDGRTVNRRAIMSYPPFVFGDPTVKAMEATRYTQTYRPDGGIGCSAASTRVRYVMPGS